MSVLDEANRLAGWITRRQQLAEASRMIGRVAERLYHDLVLAEPITPGRCSCGADAYCADYLSSGYHRGQP